MFLRERLRVGKENGVESDGKGRERERKRENRKSVLV